MKNLTQQILDLINKNERGIIGAFGDLKTTVEANIEIINKEVTLITEKIFQMTKDVPEGMENLLASSIWYAGDPDLDGVKSSFVPDMELNEGQVLCLAFDYGDGADNNLWFDKQLCDHPQTKIIAKKEGHYTKIQDAIDSIIDASENKRYNLDIKSGIYEEDLILKPFITLSGESFLTTTIYGTIKGEFNNNIIKNLHLKNFQSNKNVLDMQVNPNSEMIFIENCAIINEGSNSICINIEGSTKGHINLRNSLIFNKTWGTGIRVNGELQIQCESLDFINSIEVLNNALVNMNCRKLINLNPCIKIDNAQLYFWGDTIQSFTDDAIQVINNGKLYIFQGNISSADGKYDFNIDSSSILYIGTTVNYNNTKTKIDGSKIRLTHARDIKSDAKSLITSENLQEDKNQINERLENIYFIRGFKLEYVNDHQVKIKPGECRSDDNLEDIILTLDITLDITQDLDTGTEQDNTWYYIWIIKNPVTKEVKGLFSESYISPILPEGFTKKRRIRNIKNDLNSNFIKVYQNGIGNLIEYLYDDISLTNVLTLGEETTYTDVNCSACVPKTSTKIFINGRASKANAKFIVYLRPNGSNTEQQASIVGWEDASSTEKIDTDKDQIIEYKTEAGTKVDLYVRGYIEEI